MSSILGKAGPDILRQKLLGNEKKPIENNRKPPKPKLSFFSLAASLSSY
jgi:hypothetical protein